MRFVLLIFTLVSSQLFAASPEPTHAGNGLVTSRSIHASRAGVEIMRAGGNAVDAAVATGFALAVTYPSAGNLAGGGFAVIRLPDDEVVTLDFRERAPASAHRDMYLDGEGNVIKGLSRETHKASGVPGSVDGLLTMLDEYGSMSRKKVMAPAIRLAEQGFPLDHDLARQFRRRLDDFKAYPGSWKKFTRKGEAYEEGEIWRQPDLAATLKRISNEGRDGFYRGKTARLIVEEMERGNGEITLEDLQSYRSIWREPVHGTYRGYDIWSMGPPSSGGVLLIQMLNMIEPYDVGAMGFGSADVIHLMVEAERRAYADRAQHLGDMDYYDVPLDMLLSKQYARHRFSDFDKDRAGKSEDIEAGQWPAESPETTHYSVMDDEGTMVAVTTTLNSSYGNKIVVQGTGMLLNNEMNDFSIKRNTPNQFNLIGREANQIEPGKRMLSSMSPTLVTRNGEPFLVTGSPGGSTIITTVFQVIVNTIDHEMVINDAVAMDRFHHQWKPDMIMHGKHAFSPDTKRILIEMGHKNYRVVRYDGRGIGDANSILYEDGVMHGMKDPRNEGGAVGF